MVIVTQNLSLFLQEASVEEYFHILSVFSTPVQNWLNSVKVKGNPEYEENVVILHKMYTKHADCTLIQEDYTPQVRSVKDVTKRLKGLL